MAHRPRAQAPAVPPSRSAATRHVPQPAPDAVRAVPAVRRAAPGGDRDEAGGTRRRGDAGALAATPRSVSFGHADRELGRYCGMNRAHLAKRSSNGPLRVATAVVALV